MFCKKSLFVLNATPSASVSKVVGNTKVKHLSLSEWDA